MDFVFNEKEKRLVAGLVQQKQEAVARVAHIESALMAAISAIYAAHNLEGDFMLSDDASGFVRPPSSSENAENTGGER